jgi:hypothetical protein
VGGALAVPKLVIVVFHKRPISEDYLVRELLHQVDIGQIRR